MSSQVAHGDWGGSPAAANRGLWVGAGGALGFTIGFSFSGGRRQGGQKVSGPLPALPFALPVGRSMITAKEIAGSGAATVYQAVTTLRPEWLVERQAHTIAETLTGADISVYLDSQRLGGIADLSTVSAQNVQAIYRLSPGQATARWGAGNLNGAILIVTKD